MINMGFDRGSLDVLESFISDCIAYVILKNIYEDRRVKAILHPTHFERKMSMNAHDSKKII